MDKNEVANYKGKFQVIMGVTVYTVSGSEMGVWADNDKHRELEFVRDMGSSSTGEFKDQNSSRFQIHYKNIIKINNNNIMSDIKTKFATMFLAEPKKTFRKAGITNGDNILTEDGKTVFLGYLLEKFGDDFKKDVVDPMTKEDEEEKK